MAWTSGRAVPGAALADRSVVQRRCNREGAVIVAVHGDRTTSIVGLVAAVVADAVRSGFRAVVIDACHLRRCDQAGACALVDAIRSVRSQATSVIVTGAAASASTLLRVAAHAGELTLADPAGAPAKPA
jgi:ABC-type transporter Mla MlaB component